MRYIIGICFGLPRITRVAGPTLLVILILTVSAANAQSRHFSRGDNQSDEPSNNRNDDRAGDTQIQQAVDELRQAASELKRVRRELQDALNDMRDATAQLRTQSRLYSQALAKMKQFAPEDRREHTPTSGSVRVRHDSDYHGEAYDIEYRDSDRAASDRGSSGTTARVNPKNTGGTRRKDTIEARVQFGNPGGTRRADASDANRTETSEAAGAKSSEK